MNEFTLQFHNEALENAYLEYQNKSSIQNIYVILKLNYPLLILICIISGYTKDYLILSQTIAYFFSNLWFQRYMSSFSQRKVILVYEIMVLANPSGALVAVYFSNHSKELAICMMICLIIEVQIFITTSNILLATAQLFNYLLGVFMVVYIAFGWSLYTLIWIPFFIYTIYNYRNQKRNQRLLFQQSQVNYSICINKTQLVTLMKETAADDIIYFKLNRELLKYELELTNIENLDLDTFLSQFIIDRKQNLKQYLFSKSSINNLISDKHKIVGYINLKQKMELELYIQYYPDLKFFIRIINQQKQSIQPETQLMYSFYKRIILKAQQKPSAIHLQYIIRQISYLNARIQLGRIIQIPYNFISQIEQFNMLTIVKQQLNNIQLQYLLKHDNQVNVSVNSNKIIFETLIHGLCMIIQQHNKFTQLNVKTNDKAIISFSFSNTIMVFKVRSFLNKLNFLQNILSDDELMIEDNQIVCFMDVNKDRPFR